MATDESTLDEGFELLPAETEPPAPEVELALEEDLAAGVDTFEVADRVPAPLGRGYAYDFAARRLMPGQAGGPLMTSGLDTLAVWVEKCLRTRLGENAAVDASFGVEILAQDLIDGGPLDAGAVAEYEASARRALRVHPRIVDVEAFSVSYDADEGAGFIKFRVIPEGDDLDGFDLTLPIGGFA